MLNNGVIKLKRRIPLILAQHNYLTCSVMQQEIKGTTQRKENNDSDTCICEYWHE